MKKRIKKFLLQIAETAKVSPAETFIVLLFSTYAVLAVEEVIGNETHFLFLYPLFFCTAFLFNLWFRPRKTRTLYFISALLPLLFLWTDVSDWVNSIAYFIAVVLCVLAVFAAKWRKDNRLYVRDGLLYIKNSLSAFILSGVTFGLLTAIYFSIRYIFPSLPMGDAEKTTLYFLIFSFSMLLPLSFLSFNRQENDKDTDENRQGNDEPVYETAGTNDILMNYIITPALLIYTCILYIYFATILFTWSLPKGGIAYMVFIFTLIAILSKAIQPFLKKRHIFAWFYDRFSLISLPALIMFWIGVWYRIEQYGFTQARTYLIICGIIMTATVLIFFSPKTGKYLYANLFAIALLGIFTYIPGITAKDIGLKSQMQRIENISRRLHLLDDTGKFIAEKRPASDSIYQKEYGELYESLEYLYLEEDTDLSEKYGIESPSDLYSLIAPDAATPEYLSDTAVSGTLYSDDTVIDIAGYSSLHKIQYYKQEGCYYCTETDSSFILISPLKDTLINETLDTILKSQLKKAGLSENSPADSLKKHKQELLTYDTDAGRIVFGYLDIKQDSVLVLNYLSAELFLQK
ncbi:MAG TPA: DUF4153 domain-containing protein [Candidatus Avirikenella pullistercoris]|nr:DUF4153 domain-containing protein [Candidatus Avirikenella pullistercoris]